MRSKVLKILTLPALILIIAAAFVLAKETGTISGTITDSKTRQPLVGASVIVVGTNRGANTDLNGHFVIKNVPPGKYTLRITALGYTALDFKDVEVTADATFTVTTSLTQSTESLKEQLVVQSECDVIDKFEVSGKAIITSENKSRSALMGLPNCVAPQYESNYAHFPPAHGGSAIVNGEAFDAMFFENYGVNPFVDTEDDHLSTFAVDVDDASFILTRSYLERSNLPPKDAVRTEEFINHFDYNYPAPKEETFHVYMEGAPSKFGQNSQLLRIGIKGKKISEENRKPANLVFVIDVSGSMDREDRLELVKKALRLLVNHLNNNDNVGIVVYGSRGRIVLEPTSIKNKNAILRAIESLRPDGSTNAEEGLRLGYEMSSRHFDTRKINRIILCSDGVANVGTTKAEDLLKEIKQYADRGITLSSIGFGMGNYNDIMLEKLGNKGNGYYAYVDDIGEARRVFVENLSGALQVIARDVKIQVDFDPNIVRSYRLLGYENRDVADSKFRDDTEDGGEIGSGHSVTALYEIKLKSNYDESERIELNRHTNNLGRLFIRYKNPETGVVEEINRPIEMTMIKNSFAYCSPEFKLAACAAEFSEIMRDSYWAKDAKLDPVLQLANEVYNQTSDDNVLELMNLVSTAKKLKDSEKEIYSRE